MTWLTQDSILESHVRTIKFLTHHETEHETSRDNLITNTLVIISTLIGHVSIRIDKMQDIRAYIMENLSLGPVHRLALTLRLLESNTLNELD